MALVVQCTSLVRCTLYDHQSTIHSWCHCVSDLVQLSPTVLQRPDNSRYYSPQWGGGAHSANSSRALPVPQCHTVDLVIFGCENIGLVAVARPSAPVHSVTGQCSVKWNGLYSPALVARVARCSERVKRVTVGQFSCSVVKCVINKQRSWWFLADGRSVLHTDCTVHCSTTVRSVISSGRIRLTQLINVKM